MFDSRPKPDTARIDELVSCIGDRVRNLFQTRQLMCSESVLSVINQGLGGGLTTELCVRLTSGLPEGMGGGGCTCGAFSAGVIGLGLFLGRTGPGLGNGRRVMNAAGLLQALFKTEYRTTCCRVLMKEQTRGSATHFDLCAERTGWTAETASRIILNEKPELVLQADWTYLNQTDSPTAAGLKRIANTLRRKK